MPKFALFATAEIAPGRVDEAAALLRAHGRRCLDGEPGTLRFDVLRPKEAPQRLHLYEVYEDEAAFQAHWNGPLIARVRAEMEGMLLALSAVRCVLEE
jgi:(4S)-4-hydroxy-5-phosphonooxypentane-2,3-dione isomerase